MKVQNPIIGRSRGSAGGMTFCKNYDKNVARAKAFEVSNPKTALQTNQRTFFKELMDITKTVSDEELRSLFGIMPKAMSRRNALSKQIAAAYSVVNGQKVVDFTKLQAIGNGVKVTTPFFSGKVYDDEIEETYTLEMFGTNANDKSRVYSVIFSETKGIVITETYLWIEDLMDPSLYTRFGMTEEMGVCCGYLTIATDGAEEQRAFGSFTLKTRATKQSNAEPQPPTSIDVYANGDTIGSYFHFNENAYLKNQGYIPDSLQEKAGTICDVISFDSESNWYAGTLLDDPATPIDFSIVFTKSGEPDIEVKANWIIQ